MAVQPTAEIVLVHGAPSLDMEGELYHDAASVRAPSFGHSRRCDHGTENFRNVRQV
jgi:hypothetical protein